jgi:hypothetical protein
MFDRLGNGWEVATQSWRVLRQDKELMLFPVLSGLAALAILATFALPTLMIPGLRERVLELFGESGGSDNVAVRVGAGLVVFGYYFLNYFVMVYFNTALVACAIYRFRGGDPTVGTGLRMANERLPQIAGWALLAATVGMILNAIEERSEWLGRLVVGILGGLWTVATFLVVPTLAVEGLGPIDALKRSTGLIRQVWGEGLGGNINIGLVGFLLMLPAILIVAAGVALTSSGHLPGLLLALLILAAVIYGLGVAVVTTAAKQVFIAGLYVYATEKRVPPGFAADAMRGAFVRK